nr:ester cyclase [bacterium]
MYLKRVRSFRLLFVALILSVALLATLFTELALAQGKIITDTITSPSLEGNLMGDPATRNMTIYLPPSYEEGGNFPVVYLLHGYGGNEGSFATADSPYLPENGFSGMLDDLIAAGELKEVIIVTPNGSNKYGGSFYTNSELSGNYEDYIVEDIVSFIDTNYHTITSRNSRAIVGISMGGYGSMKLAMKHPDVFGAVASHSGPLYFDATKPLIPAVVAENPDGMMGPHSEKQFTTFAYGFSAAFSPNLENPPFFVDLPFEYPTGAIIDEVWDRWLEHDAFTMLSNYGGNLASLRGVYLDCGDQDELGITPHAIAFHQALADAGIEHEYEIFAGGHGDKFYERLPISLKFLSDVLISTDDLEANKAVRRRLFEEVWNQGNVDVIDEIYAEDFVGDYGDNEGFKQFIAATFDAIPDVHVTLEDIFAEGDMVATRYTFTGTHQGEFMGIPPTGVKGPMTGVSIARIVDGRIQKVWDDDDFLALMQQWGVIPSTREGYAWGAPSEVTGDPGDAETNKAIVRRVIDEIWLQGNLELADEFIHPNHHFNEAPGDPSSWGIDAYKGNIALWNSILSDMHTNIDAILAEGDKVAIHVTNTGTHTGTLFGVPATMKQLEFSLTAIMRIADGKIVETWMVKDSMSIIEQLQQPPEPVEEAEYEVYVLMISMYDDGGGLFRFADELRPEVYDKNREDAPITCIYVKGPDVELIYGPGPSREAMEKALGVEDQFYIDHETMLSRIGVSLEQINYVVVDHTCFDHPGGVDLFPNATVIIEQAAFDKPNPLAIPLPDGSLFNLALEEDYAKLEKIREEGRLKVVDGDYEIAPGLKMYYAPGHTYETNFLGINTKDGTVVMTGDSCYTYLNLKHNLLPVDWVTTDADLMLQSYERIRQVMGSSDALLVPGHDMDIFKRFHKVADRVVQIKLPHVEYSNVFFMPLASGLNMVSLPLEPQTPYTARSFAEKLSATTVIKLDEARQRFTGFTLDAPDDGFQIEGGKGYIVNVPESGMVAFTGAAWS